MKQIVINQQITKRESDSFKKYLQEISKIEPFATSKDEHECAVKAWTGDKKAKDELIRRNLRFVVSCAKQYQINGVTLEDLVNEGNVGITNAADRFDPTMGFKFISYAVWYIKKEIIQFLSSHGRMIRLPNNKIDAVAKFRTNISKLEQELQRPVETNDILKAYSEYTKDDIDLLNELAFNNVSSLDISVGDDDSSTLADLIIDDNIGSDELVMKSDIEVNINNLISVLTPNEHKIITMLYGLDGQSPCTLADVGEVFNISRESVRQKKDKAFKKIKRNFSNYIEYLEYI
jgi:RNA polymerase primary sigma factor